MDLLEFNRVANGVERATSGGMAKINSHRDLLVWQKAMSLVESCYELTNDFPSDERFGLTMQLRRAAVSIPSNIAEGFNRHSRGAYLNHVGIALGSQAEVSTQVEVAVRLGFATQTRGTMTADLADEVGCLLHNLGKALENGARKGR